MNLNNSRFKSHQMIKEKWLVPVKKKVVGYTKLTKKVVVYTKFR